MKNYRDRAVVMRSWPLGEADRIVEMYGMEAGKLRAVSKGVRGRRSRNSGLMQVTAEVDVMLWRGRDLDTLVQAALVRPNLVGPEIELDAYQAACELIETVDRLTPDRQPNPQIYRLLSTGLRMIAEEWSPFLLGSLLLRLLQLEGYAPLVGACSLCGRRDRLERFDFGSSSARCSDCGGEPVAPEVIAVVQRVLDARVREVLAQRPGPEAGGFEGLVARLVAEHAGRSLRSAGVRLTP